jgi:ATP-dependent DNA helicase RecQ
VSPLIALMADQVESLRRRGIQAAEVNSTVPPDEQDRRIEAAAKGEVKLLYVAPERFRNERFRRRIQGVVVSLVAVDEAHCISQWGHDFRPDYRRLLGALDELGRPQVIALTATAPTEVQDDVVEQLGLRDPARFLDGLVRANLCYAVLDCRSQAQKDGHLLTLLERPGAAIVYAATRKQVERLAELLADAGHPALRYHAGLADEERAAAQDAFLAGGAPLMVATNAFGMGVDRPDVRQVVHFEVPRSVEAYVQESGRAGRDGLPADCTLLFHGGDLHVQRFFIDAANPPREVVADVLRVLEDAGERRLELTAEAIAARMTRSVPAASVSAALAILDRAEVVHRGRRSENLARVTVLPSEGDLFQVQPLPPGVARLLATLVERFGVGNPSSLDVDALARTRGITPETLRRGLSRLHELARIEYVPPFRGRATELLRPGGEGASVDEVLAAVDFAALDERRQREEGKLDEMVSYARAWGCRRRFLLERFGAHDAPRCGRCDRCRAAAGAALRKDRARPGRDPLRDVLEAVRAHDGRFGFQRLAQHLAGSKAKGVRSGGLSRGPTFGALANQGVAAAEELLKAAQGEGLLALLPRTLPGDRRVHVLALTREGREVLDGSRPVPTIGRPS